MLPYTPNVALTKEDMLDLTKLTPAERDEQSRYRSGVAAALYPARMTRPDISYAVSRLGRYAKSPGPTHQAELKVLMRYLVGTAHLGLKYTKDTSPEGMQFQAYADADYASDVDTRKSVSGYILQFQGAPISWLATLQKSVTLSTCEAEVMALSKCCQEVVFMRGVFASIDRHLVPDKPQRIQVNGGAGSQTPERDFAWDPTAPTVTYCDNAAAVLLANKDGSPRRLKHVSIREFFCREQCERGAVDVVFIGSNANVADSQTKTQKGPLFLQQRARLLGHGRAGASHDYHTGMRVGEAKHPGPCSDEAVPAEATHSGPYPSVAAPTEAEARRSPAAACAYYALVVMPDLREMATQPGVEVPEVGGCQTCGRNTRHWCHRCQVNGCCPVWLHDGTPLPTPMCTACKNENRKRHYCGVRGGNVPDREWMANHGLGVPLGLMGAWGHAE